MSHSLITLTPLAPVPRAGSSEEQASDCCVSANIDMNTFPPPDHNDLGHLLLSRFLKAQSAGRTDQQRRIFNDRDSDTRLEARSQ